jgi:hypothetical protein
MKTLAVALTMLAAAMLNAAALEPHAPQHALTEHLSAGKNRYLGNWIAGATELSRGRAFDRQGANVLSVRCGDVYRQLDRGISRY